LPSIDACTASQVPPCQAPRPAAGVHHPPDDQRQRPDPQRHRYQGDEELGQHGLRVRHRQALPEQDAAVATLREQAVEQVEEDHDEADQQLRQHEPGHHDSEDPALLVRVAEQLRQRPLLVEPDLHAAVHHAADEAQHDDGERHRERRPDEAAVLPQFAAYEHHEGTVKD
jgi:hypothetical protein